MSKANNIWYRDRIYSYLQIVYKMLSLSQLHI